MQPSEHPASHPSVNPGVTAKSGSQMSVEHFKVSNDLAPTFNDPADGAALEVIASCFPKHRVVGIHPTVFLDADRCCRTGRR